MPVGSGPGAQLIIGKETTPGTAVTPSRAYEFNSESLALTKNTVQGNGPARRRSSPGPLLASGVHDPHGRG